MAGIFFLNVNSSPRNSSCLLTFQSPAVYDNQGGMDSGTEVRRFLLQDSNPAHGVKVLTERYGIFPYKSDSVDWSSS